MTSEELGRLAARPPSEMEWEDLLVRLEIVPRVVRNALEDAEPRAEALAVLADLVRTEARVGRLLEEAAGLPGSPDPRPEAAAPPSDATDLAHRFASLRARTFAMVQRRGLEVWEWEVVLEGGSRATVYQLLDWLRAHDGAMLAALRGALRPGAGAC